jgi:surface antigen
MPEIQAANGSGPEWFRAAAEDFVVSISSGRIPGRRTSNDMEFVMKKISMLLAVLALVVSGCAPQLGPKETGGTLLGAGTGALIGSQIGHGHGRLLGVAIGTLAGALIGQDVGRTLDRADQVEMEGTAQVALEGSKIHQTSTWVNPDSGNSGSFTPVKTYQAADGDYCREYIHTVTVAGKQQQAHGTACRRPDGTWSIANSKG